MRIRKAAVIGAGTMGAGIATHLANAGIPCLLLDIVPAEASESSDPRARSRLAIEALERAAKSKPAAFMTPQAAALVTPGNTSDDLAGLADCDWIVEAVTERLDIKRALYQAIAAHRRPGSIVSSNTSGLALNLLTEGLDDELCQHFLITHFFNPPRYMYLLELVRGPKTSDEVFECIASFAELRLGKGVVECKDTPNFIANRIGVFSMGASCQLFGESGLSIEEVDALTGPALGRPKTATFRLHDLVGIDVALMVMKNVRDLVPDDESRDLFVPPAWLERMVTEGRLGRKSGAGFYKKVGAEILVLDLETFEYRPQRPVELPCLAAAKKTKSLAERIQAVVSGDDAGARYAWRLLSETLVYAARRAGEIADDIVSIDRAMRWGFNWELGPFELWDALGVRKVVERLEREKREVPDRVRSLLASGRESFYEWSSGEGAELKAFDVRGDSSSVVPARDGVLSLESVRHGGAPVHQNAAGKLWDIGEGVLLVELTSKMNTINGETLALIRDGIRRAEGDGWHGIVIGGDAANFSLGANLVELGTAASAKQWDRIEAMIRDFHETALEMRYSAVPLVAAVQGMALGGGCEIPLACDHVQAAAESYIGLVELGVGLIPAGGGTREMACRAQEALGDVEADFLPILSHYFQNIAMAKTSNSAAEARGLGYLRPSDAISFNRDRVLADARRRVLLLAAEGYRPPPTREQVRVAGEPGIAEFTILLHQYQSGGFVSEYDAFLARRLAHVICGGAIDAECRVSERYLLDLEREVFLGLLGEQKTLDRIAHTLKTGKPLRN